MRGTSIEVIHSYAILTKLKKLVVITGHGIMAKEFIGWVSADPYAIKCERLNPNTGAWRMNYKKITN